MPGALSLAARQAVTAQQTDQVFLVLLTIDPGPAAAPVRLVNDAADLVSRGQTFLAFPFEIELPGDDAERLRRVRLRIDNVHRSLVALLRGLAAPPRVTLEVVRAAEPDVVEAGPFDLAFVSAQYDARVIEIELGPEDILNARFPAGDYSPADYPGLF
ncbi:MAG: DUF1833 domain-containing protein [Burkholderiaceae bacterium]|nr:DUF1833 domain-containing protein [Burkholderiaceae bacterium]